MSGFEAALLGVVQGLTEFLPISSSAHLILARTAFDWDAGEFGLAFDVACHVGTLVAVVVFFRQDIVTMIVAAPAAFRGAQDEHARLLRSIAIGTIPIVLVGFFFADLITSTLRTASVAAGGLVAGAVLMLVAERIRSRSRAETALTGAEAFGLGLAQATALIPGVSRSGAVLSVAMIFGVRRERAARFSFLLGIPAIMVAAGRESLNLAVVGLPGGGAPGLFLIGIVSSAVVGYLTVKYFIQYLGGHSLDIFSAYRVILGAGIGFTLL